MQPKSHQKQQKYLYLTIGNKPDVAEGDIAWNMYRELVWHHRSWEKMMKQKTSLLDEFCVLSDRNKRLLARSLLLFW